MRLNIILQLVALVALLGSVSAFLITRAEYFVDGRFGEESVYQREVELEILQLRKRQLRAEYAGGVLRYQKRIADVKKAELSAFEQQERLEGLRKIYEEMLFAVIERQVEEVESEIERVKNAICEVNCYDLVVGV